MGIIWPEKMVCAKSTHSMSLPIEQRTLVTATVDMQQKGGNLDELRRVAVRLLDQAVGKFEEELFVNQKEEEASEDDQEYTPDEIMALQRARAIKAKPRGGNLSKSIKDARHVYGAADEGADSGNVCCRCKKTGRWWKNCPMPFSRNLIFPKSKGAGKPVSGGEDHKGGKPAGAAGKGGRKLFWVNDIHKGESVDPTPNEEGKVVDCAHDNNAPEILTVEVPSDDVDYEECYDEFGRCGDLVVEEIALKTICKTTSLGQESNSRCTGGLIDSGASACLCGLGWITQWSKGKISAPTSSSSRRFKFGEGTTIASAGKAVTKCWMASQESDVVQIPAQHEVDITPGSMPLLISYDVLK